MQVWFKDRQVGEAKVPSPHPGAREIRMQVLSEGVLRRPAMPPGAILSDDSLVVETIRLPLDWNSFKLSSLQFMQEGPEIEERAFLIHGVKRHECEKILDLDRDFTIYRYRIIRATASLLEEIFDMDWYEPADGERDPNFYEQHVHTGDQITLSSGIRLNTRPYL